MFVKKKSREIIAEFCNSLRGKKIKLSYQDQSNELSQLLVNPESEEIITDPEWSVIELFCVVLVYRMILCIVDWFIHGFGFFLCSARLEVLS